MQVLVLVALPVANFMSEREARAFGPAPIINCDDRPVADAHDLRFAPVQRTVPDPRLQQPGQRLQINLLGRGNAVALHKEFRTQKDRHFLLSSPKSILSSSSSSKTSSSCARASLSESSDPSAFLAAIVSSLSSDWTRCRNARASSGA